MHCCVTSPPYFNLRDYGTGQWVGGSADCNHTPKPSRGKTTQRVGRRRVAAETKPYQLVCKKCGARRTDEQIGLEKTPEEYVKKLVRVFREVRRALRPDGTFWLNIADTRRDKNLLGIPHRLVFALIDDGWIWRDEIIWHAPNKMPESVRDRCTKAHEFVFMLTKSKRYYYDARAIKEPNKSPIGTPRGPKIYQNAQLGARNGLGESTLGGASGAFVQKRSVWAINTEQNRENHFAAFPKKLVLPCILAGTSSGGCCSECGAPRRRLVDSDGVKTTGWEPSCGCIKRYATGHGDYAETTPATRPCVVLDCFGGTGTTAAVALANGRHAITMDLNPEYVEYIRRKTGRAIAKRGFCL